MDFLDLSLGSHYGIGLMIAGIHHDSGYQLPTSETVTRKVSLPTIVCGRVSTLAQAEAILASGATDLVGMTRATLAEPELVTKTLSGRTREVRPCIACLQGCAGGLNRRAQAVCTVNPAAAASSPSVTT